MKLKRILLFSCCMLVALCGMTGLYSCSDDDDTVKVTIYTNPEWENAENIIAVLGYDDISGTWCVEPDIHQYNPFWKGDELGSVITIINWDDNFKQYADGCVFSGEYRLVKSKIDYRIEGIPVGNYFFELKINSIDRYQIKPM